MAPGNALRIPAFGVISAKNPIIRGVLAYTMSASAKAVADLARWCAEGEPRFSIAGRFPLDEVGAAHQVVEVGTKIGHVVLDIA